MYFTRQRGSLGDFLAGKWPHGTSECQLHKAPFASSAGPDRGEAFAVQRTGCCTKFLVRLSTIPHEVCLSAYSVGGGRQSLLVCQIHCLDDLSFTPFLMYWGSFHQLCVFLFFSVYFNQTVYFNQKESFNVHLIP